MISSTPAKAILKGFTIIKSLLLNYKKDLFILGLLGIISSIASALNPYLSGRILDSIAEPMQTFLFILGFWVFVNLIKNIIDWKGGIKREYLSATVSADYTVRSLAKILEMPLSFHKDRKIGSIIHRIARAAGALEPILSRVLIDLMPQFLSIIIAIGICFFVNSKLAVVLILAVVIYICILIKKVRPIAEIATKMHQAYQRAYGNASDSIINVQSVKQATAEKQEQKKLYKGFQLSAIGFRKKLVTIWNGLSFYQRIIILFTQLIIFSYSLFLIKQGAMTIGELVMFWGYNSMMFGPFFTLGNYWHMIQNGAIALAQSEKILNLPTENYTPQNAVMLTEIKGKISFQNVSFYYKKGQEILENINFEIQPGEIAALVGESGVGKSTLVDLISGFYFARSGKLLVDGHDIKKIDLKFLRSKISVVPQEILLFNDTVGNNIKYGSFGASEEKIKKAAKMAHADEFIEKFPKKYGQIVGERGIKLSAGQKQRIAIARAILQDPRILILDEPTSSLDAQSEKFIQESLVKLMKGRTTIIIAHRFSTLRKADKIIVLDKGHIIEQGKHEDLVKIKNGIYHCLYELQDY
jgi:subfamily B ATP-binding cassette protein MsbA